MEQAWHKLVAELHDLAHTSDRPVAESISGHSNVLSRLVPRVDFGVDNMGRRQRRAQQSVHMSWETFEACLIAQKAMDVDKEQGPSLVVGRFDSSKRLSRRIPRITNPSKVG